MEIEINKLENAIRELTATIHVLKASIHSLELRAPYQGNGKNTPVPNHPSAKTVNPVCTDPDCGVINSNSITCEHTLARYRSEYHCG